MLHANHGPSKSKTRKEEKGNRFRVKKDGGQDRSEKTTGSVIPLMCSFSGFFPCKVVWVWGREYLRERNMASGRGERRKGKNSKKQGGG